MGRRVRSQQQARASGHPGVQSERRGSQPGGADDGLAAAHQMFSRHRREDRPGESAFGRRRRTAELVARITRRAQPSAGRSAIYEGVARSATSAARRGERATPADHQQDRRSGEGRAQLRKIERYQTRRAPNPTGQVIFRRGGLRRTRSNTTSYILPNEDNNSTVV